MSKNSRGRMVIASQVKSGPGSIPAAFPPLSPHGDQWWRWLARQVVGQQDHWVSDVASLAILSALKNLRQKNTLASHLVDTEHSILRAFKSLELKFGNTRKLTIL